MLGKFSSNAELIAARVKIEFLEKENKELRAQVQNLQDALIAKASPMAYASMMSERAKEEEKPSSFQTDAELLKHYLSELEGRPAFSSADAFINYVKGVDPTLQTNLEDVITAAPESIGSLHSNEES